MSSISVIVACDKNWGIGIENRLPWHLPEDLAHFKRTTLGHPIIMGRKTFDSIGRPLPKRRNIVVTRNTQWQHEGVEVAHSLEEAYALLQEERAFVIGGADIYRQAIAQADTVWLTRINHEYACDAFFPQLNAQEWQIEQEESFQSIQNTLSYSILKFNRI